MSYNGNSPMNFLGMIAGLGSINKLTDEALRSRYDKLSGSTFGKMKHGKRALTTMEAEMQRRQSIGSFGRAPAVSGIAGTSRMSGRIESIESRLQALEGGGASPEIAEPVAEVAPMETEPAPIATPDVTEGGVVPPVAQDITPAADALGQNFASSPFFKRQRTNMGPLMFKDQTGDGKITRADVIKARIEGYKK